MMRFLENRAGHTAIEYSMIAGLIAITLIAALSIMGVSVTGMFEGALIPAFAGQAR